MHPSLPSSLDRAVNSARRALGRCWRKLRGTGEFDRPEDSARCRILSEQWELIWPGTPPVGHHVRESHPTRWVRFHSLPESECPADRPDEHDEMLHRHHTLLADLLAGSPVESLIVVARDWDAIDLWSGWSRRQLREAWPWRIVELPDDEVREYIWVTTGLSSPELDVLLTAAADDQNPFFFAASDLAWIYYPYEGGGADVIVSTSADRNALRDRHPAWRSSLWSGW